jgi:radical SAM protein with 4Fe4S-binding SPASM domain
LGADEYPWIAKGIRRPFHAGFELTERCNNRCSHCYTDPGGSKPPELPLGFWTELMDALVEEECLFAMFTGGEPLLRPDFADLWRAAKRRGILPSLLTNACLVDEAIIELLTELPPRVVSVSLYGATRETYEAVTQTRGSYEAAMRGLRMLQAAGLPLHMKAMLLRANIHELDAMYEVAGQFGCMLLTDGAIMPTADGDPCVQAQRLSPEEVVAAESRVPGKLEAFREFWDERVGTPPNRRLYTCRTGLRNLHIDAQGRVRPCAGGGCTTWQLDFADIAGSLRRIFYDEMPKVLWNEDAGDSPCARCALQVLCGTCPIARGLEAGSPRNPVAFGCQVARLRARALGIDAVPAVDEPAPAQGAVTDAS